MGNRINNNDSKNYYRPFIFGFVVVVEPCPIPTDDVVVVVVTMMYKLSAAISECATAPTNNPSRVVCSKRPVAVTYTLMCARTTDKCNISNESSRYVRPVTAPKYLPFPSGPNAKNARLYCNRLGLLERLYFFRNPP